jgi:hypothetical protein
MTCADSLARRVLAVWMRARLGRRPARASLDASTSAADSARNLGVAAKAALARRGFNDDELSGCEQQGRT